MPTNQESARAVAYVRVSTDDQATEGISLEAQERALRAYCEAQGWTLTTVEADAGVSGRTLDRDGLRAALALVEAGEADVLLAMKVDRLTRSVVDLYGLVQRVEGAGGRLATVQDNLDTGTANGRLVTSILATIAQWEREIVSERTAATLALKRANGEHVGAVPYGFRLNGAGTLVEAPHELATIQKMKRMRRRGASYQRIADTLNADGIASRRGSWSKSSVHALVNDHLRSRKARYLGGSSGRGVQ